MSSSTGVPSFSSKIVGSSSISTPTKTCGIATLSTFWKPMEKQDVDNAIAKLFYAYALPFNLARSPYYKNAVKKIVDFGKGYAPPGSEALRTTLLKKTKERVTNRLAEINKSWKFTDCTILSDGWSDSCYRPLINVLVYYPQGVYFLKAFDAMNADMKTS